jgi:pyruvate-ferredoxin/flavodoxin oxidoreductase
VACHTPAYVIKGFDMVRDVRPGGVFLINCQWTPEELAERLPAKAKRYIARNNIQLYTINAIDLAIELGMGKRTNTILQSAFFTLAKVIPHEQAIGYMKDAATKSYLKKGQDIVDMNHRAIDAGTNAFVKIDVPADWADATDEKKAVSLAGDSKVVKMVENLMIPMSKMRRQPAVSALPSMPTAPSSRSRRL